MTEKTIYASVDAMAPEMWDLARYIYANPELGHEEFKSCAAVTAAFRRHGFTVEEGVAGLPTAFKATWGTEGPVIGLLCEYDALPKLGHGCGHHMQAPVMLGAAVAIRENLGEAKARIEIYGTPAEESSGGKLPMDEAGLFNNLDVAFMMHGGDRTCTDNKNLAMIHLEFVFTGKASHAAVAPENGINALSAVLLLFNGIGFLREHMRQDARIHGIITDGGVTPNTIPARGAARFYVRAADRRYRDELAERVRNIARGASLATGATLEINTLKICDNKMNTESLNELLMDEAAKAGAVNITGPRKNTGSTDFGCVTYRAPATCLRACFVPLGMGSHSVAWVEKGVSEEARAAVMFAAKAIAAASLRLVCESDLLARIREDFETSRKAYDDVTPETSQG